MNLILCLISFLLAMAAHLHAMDQQPSFGKKILRVIKQPLHTLQRKVQAFKTGYQYTAINRELARYLPSDTPAFIAILPENEAITDELLCSLNPKWVTFHATLSDEQRTKLWGEAFNCMVYGRTEDAKSLCILFISLTNPNILLPANPDEIAHMIYEMNFSGFVDYIMRYHQNYHLIKYLLNKKTVCKKLLTEWPTLLTHSNSVPVALSCMQQGCRVTKDLLFTSSDYTIPAELMEFYLATDEIYNEEYIGPRVHENPLHEGGLMYAYPMTPNNTINSTKKIFLLLQAEPKLRTVTGDLLLAADDVFGTPLHYGSQRQSSTFCRSVVAYYMCEYGNFLNRFNTYLCSIKKKFPSFYSSKDLRKLIFEYAAPPTMKKLHALLGTKNKNGITAYELWSQKTAYKDENLEPLELLNPDTCSYKSKRAEVITCEIEPKFELMQQFYNAMQSKKRSLCI